MGSIGEVIIETNWKVQMIYCYLKNWVSKDQVWNVCIYCMF